MTKALMTAKVHLAQMEERAQMAILDTLAAVLRATLELTVTKTLTIVQTIPVKMEEAVRMV